MFQLMAYLPQYFNGNKGRHQLIAAFSNLWAHLFKRDVIAEMRKGFNSRPSMKIDGINQRTIDIKNHCVGPH
jgi:hypothetical protein